MDQDQIDKAFAAFKANQTMTSLQVLHNLGVKGIKKLENNEWRPLNVYKLPLENPLLLYEKTTNGMKPYAVGTYDSITNNS